MSDATNGIVKQTDTLIQNSNSTVERLIIWKASLSLIRHNFIFGVGTGDVNDGLMKEYKERNFQAGLKKHLNSHNQFFQTFIALGITGVTILVLMILFPLILSLKRRDYRYFLFIMIIALNLAFESLFETQSGIVFYAFFNTLFFCTMQKKEIRPGSV